MKNLLFKLFAFAIVLVVANACNETLVTDESVGDEVNLKSANNGKQSYIVVLQDTDLDAELVQLKGYEKKQAAVKSASAKILKRAGVLDVDVEHVYGTALKGFSVKIPPGQLKKLENDPAVKYVEEDGIISLSPPLHINAVSATSTQSTPWGITRVQGGGANLTSGSPKAWIVDSGIDLDHPDLNVNTALSKSFVAGDSSPDDAHGHGTHVAGTVAAINNDYGVIGVAPNTEVISCRVLGSDGTGSFSWTIAALDYIAGVASPGDVVNMSLGPQVRYTDQAVDDAVIGTADAGIKIAIAAGNSSDDASYYSPARVNHNNVYTVAAMAEGDVWASYSNFGSPVDYIEPGSYVTSTYIDGYAQMSGTSMASPHMAGILVLGDFVTDGTVSIKKRQYYFDYPIAVVDGNGTDPEPTNTPPKADFSTSVDGLTVSFTNTSSDDDGDAVSVVNWDFGDGSTTSTTNPTHTYAAVGTYNVSLTVTDGTDTDVATQSVTVSDNTGGKIVLEGAITGNKVKKVTLTWTGASGATVSLYLNDNDPVIVTNSGSYIENLGKIEGGTYEYYIVDEAGVTSNPIDLSF